MGISEIAPESQQGGREALKHGNGLVEKCIRFTEEADGYRKRGLYPFFRCIESAQDTEVLVDGRPMLMLGSNSYLGLTNHPRIKERVIEAVKKYGTGCGGSRLLNGTLSIHLELEEALAEMVGKESALVFSTGFQTNLGAITGILDKNDAVLIDKTDHASILDGCRLSLGPMLRYRHNDMADLERRLSRCKQRGKLIVVDGVFSMEGDIAPLPKIIELGRRYHAAVMCDDAHALGVLGATGAGTGEHFGMADRLDIIMGTFSKSLASVGGFIAAQREIIEYIKHRARALIFSASISPANAAAALAALEVIRDEPERRARLWENAIFFREGLRSMGVDTGHSETPIIPIIIGDDMTTFRIWRTLHDSGIFLNAVIPPAVPRNQSLLRLSLMATHTQSQLARALETIEGACRSVGLI